MSITKHPIRRLTKSRRVAEAIAARRLIKNIKAVPAAKSKGKSQDLLTKSMRKQNKTNKYSLKRAVLRRI